MARDDDLVRTLVLVIAAIILLPFLMMALMMPVMGIWGWGHMADAGMWTGTPGTLAWIVTSLIPLLVVIGIGYLVYRAFQDTGRRRTDPALEELRIAYARGDLSDEEFEQRRQRLEREG